MVHHLQGSKPVGFRKLGTAAFPLCNIYLMSVPKYHCFMQVAVSDIPEGSVVQLHVRDPLWAQNNILKQLQVC